MSAHRSHRAGHAIPPLLRSPVLPAVAILAMLALAGCMPKHNTTTPPSWPQWGGNAQRTGYTPISTLGVSKLRWKSSLSGRLGNPVVGSDGFLHVTSSEGHLYALDMRNGRVRWKIRIADGFVPPSEDADSAASTAPALPITYAQHHGKRGTIYCASDENYFFAFDSITTQKSRTPVPSMTGAAKASGAPLLAPDGTLYAVYVNVLTAYDGATGKERWCYYAEMKDKEGHTTAKPIEGIAVGEDGAVYLVAGALIRLDPEKGKPAWRFIPDSKAEIRGSPVVEPNGNVFVVGADNRLYAVSSLGGFSHWSRQYPDEQIVSPVAIDASGVVYFATDVGKVHAIQARKGAELWTMTHSLGIVDQPLVGANGRLYAVGTTASPGMKDTTLAVHELDAKTGELIRTSGPMVTGPSVSASALAVGPDGTIFVGTSDGVVFAWN